jgi:predicted transcriptional regulator
VIIAMFMAESTLTGLFRWINYLPIFLLMYGERSADMRKVTIQVESIEAGLERFKLAWNTGAYQGEFITFETLDAMLSTLTSKRWSLVRVLQARGPMSIRALARVLNRDVKNVHTDVQALKEIGLIEGYESQVRVPYTEIEAHLTLAA